MSVEAATKEQATDHEAGQVIDLIVGFIVSQAIYVRDQA